MTDFFKASEVLEIAIQVEQNGEDFYRGMAEKIKEDNVRALFSFLADEDVKHRKIFEDLLSRVDRYEPSESYPGEYSAYLGVHAGEHVFTREKTGKLMVQRIRTVRKAMDFAIDVEVDSILYYLAVKNYVSVGDRPVVEKIIDEEHSHYLKLLGMRKTFKKV